MRRSPVPRGNLPTQYDPATLHRQPMSITELETMAHCASDVMPYFIKEETCYDTSWRRQIYLRAHPGLSQTPLWGVVRDSQHRGDGFPGSRLCLPAPGPSSHGL